MNERHSTYMGCKSYFANPSRNQEEIKHEINKSLGKRLKILQLLAIHNKSIHPLALVSKSTQISLKHLPRAGILKLHKNPQNHPSQNTQNRENKKKKRWGLHVGREDFLREAKVNSRKWGRLLTCRVSKWRGFSQRKGCPSWFCLQEMSKNRLEGEEEEDKLHLTAWQEFGMDLGRRSKKEREKKKSKTCTL